MTAKLTQVGVLLAALGAMFAGGCVSREDYNKARLAADSSEQARQDAFSKMQAAESEWAIANQNIAALQSQLAQEKQLVASYEASNDLLMIQLRDLRAKLNDDTTVPPPVVGPALPASLDRQLAAWANANPDLVEYDRQRGMVKFKTDLLFAKGSDDVGSKSREVLKKFASIVSGGEAGAFMVYIAGHTDDVPISRPGTRLLHPTNMHLSVHRSISVMDVLAGAGIKPDRIGVMGFGSYHPIAPNAAGKKGNPLNRRVEIWIVPPGRFLTTDAMSTGGSSAPVREEEVLK